MWFSDPFLSHLKQYGYLPVRLPKVDLKPMELLTKEGKDLDRYASIDTIFREGENIPLPRISENNQAPNISGHRSSDFKIGIALSILGDYITTIAGSAINLTSVFQGAKKISFGYDGVLEDRIEVATLEKFLADSDIDPSIKNRISDLLTSEALYVVSSTIKSQIFSINAKDSQGANVKANVPLIQLPVEPKVRVSASGQSGSDLTLKTDVPLVFGFQAKRIFYHDDHFSLKPVEPGKLAARELSLLANDGTETLMVDSPFISLTKV